MLYIAETTATTPGVPEIMLHSGTNHPSHSETSWRRKVQQVTIDFITIPRLPSRTIPDKTAASLDVAVRNRTATCTRRLASLYLGLAPTASIVSWRE